MTEKSRLNGRYVMSISLHKCLIAAWIISCCLTASSTANSTVTTTSTTLVSPSSSTTNSTTLPTTKSTTSSESATTGSPVETSSTTSTTSTSSVGTSATTSQPLTTISSSTATTTRILITGTKNNTSTAMSTVSVTMQTASTHPDNSTDNATTKTVAPDTSKLSTSDSPTTAFQTSSVTINSTEPSGSTTTNISSSTLLTSQSTGASSSSTTDSPTTASQTSRVTINSTEPSANGTTTNMSSSTSLAGPTSPSPGESSISTTDSQTTTSQTQSVTITSTESIGNETTAPNMNITSSTSSTGTIAQSTNASPLSTTADSPTTASQTSRVTINSTEPSANGTTTNISSSTSSPGPTSPSPGESSISTTDSQTTTSQTQSVTITSTESIGNETTAPNMNITSSTSSTGTIAQSTNASPLSTTAEISSTNSTSDGTTTTTTTVSPETSTSTSTTTSDIDECAANPCKNGANCTDEVNHFTCSCMPGYTGTTCETDINDCASNPCEHGGNCTDAVNHFTCSCMPGYTGTTCGTDINDCASKPCENGGNCTDEVNHFTCSCMPGYTGSTCETDINDCASKPCENGGNCTDEVNHFTCSCMPGYTGTTCETDINECASKPCKNGGNCTDAVNNFTCSCMPGYTGSTCGTDINDCASKPCKNGGNCIDAVNNFTCSCMPGYTGVTCGTDINDCASNPCENGGNCTDAVNHFTCSCMPGYTGTTCGTDIDDCAPNPCENDGKCKDAVNNFTCSCTPGFTGATCETDIDDCASTPCMNGTCIDAVNNFTCSCTPGFTGATCETDIDDCAPNPCKFEGNCTDAVNSFTCSCAAGLSGATCNNDIDECANVTQTRCHINNTLSCFNTAGSFKCICEDGWTGDNCQDNINECNKNPCSPSANCTDTYGNYTCKCNDGYRGDGFHCVEETLIPVHPNTELRSGDDSMYLFTVPSGIPYFDDLYSNIYVYMNGYITLGQSINARYSPASWSDLHFPIIAPLWTDLETRKENNSGVYITEITNRTVLENLPSDLGKLILNPRYALMVTWKKAVLYPFAQNAKYESADFQVVLLTNNSHTSFMLNYDQELFTLKVADQYVTIGYSQQKFQVEHVLKNLSFSTANTNSNIGKNGRWIFNVSSASDQYESAARCRDWQNDNTNKIDNAKKDSEPCPCSLMQAWRDRRFRYSENRDNSYQFMSRFRRMPSNTRQRCHYTHGGSLIRGYPGGGYLEASSDSNITEGYDLCCTQTKLCSAFYEINPSDNCRRYQPPTWSPSWGDPHITTLDKKEYTFNGKGEYTLLEMEQGNGSVKVQVRTDYVSGDSKDATVFVGLAAQEQGGDIVQLLLDRTKNKTEIYINGELNGNFTSLKPHNISTEFNMVAVEAIINGDNDSLYIIFQSGFTLQIGVTNILDIVVIAPESEDFKNKTKGLVGNYDGNKTNDFIMKNGTVLPSESSEKDIFDFGSTWKINCNDDSSLFNYTIENKTCHNYTNDDEPKCFISDNLEDLKCLNETCKGHNTTLLKTSIIETCEGNKACIVDSVATCNVEFGKTTRETQDIANKTEQMLDNNPPSITADDAIDVISNNIYTMDMNTNITDDNLDTIVIDTNISSADYTFSNNTFKWNVTDALRNSPVNLKFIATDKLNASSEYRPLIRYCGCMNPSECYFPQIDENSYNEDRFLRARCNCTANKEGDFCQHEKELCNPNPCFPNVVCNSSTPEELCGKCPKGMEGDGKKCEEVNECYRNEAICPEKSECINNDVSYTCKCNHGYVLNTVGDKCDDINECKEGNHNCGNINNSYCSDIEGGFECLCEPGYAKTESGTTCIKVSFSFVGRVKFEVSSKYTSITDLRGAIQTVLNGIFNVSEIHLKYVEIVSLQPDHASRRRRSTDGESNYTCAFIVHSEGNAVTTQTVIDVFKKKTSNAADGIFSNLDTSIPLNIFVSESEVFDDIEKSICDFPDQTNCDQLSTTCIPANGTYSCECKRGFVENKFPITNCRDDNECERASSSQVCCNGTCNNTIGSYTCHCKAGFEYDGNKYCVDVCRSNPCQNGGECIHGDKEGQFICKCDDVWAGHTCELENAETTRLKTTAIAVGASVGGVCLLLVFALLGFYRRQKRKMTGYSRRPLSFTDPLDNYTNIPRAHLRGLKDMPIDDDFGDDSTLSIPRPQYEMIENNGRPDSQDIGKFEEEDKPLTTTKKEKPQGQGNPSFLHSETMQGERRSTPASKNNYEYF